jgi:hypothetical protein
MYLNLPPNFTTHFEPLTPFLEWWAEYVNGRIVYDCGAGCCGFTKAMHERGLKALAIEPRANYSVRQECASFLYPTSIYKCKLLSTTPGVVVTARPDHSGWIRDIPSLIHPDSEYIYIGLQDNFNIDLYDWDYEVLYQGAGEDDEWVLKINN